MMDICTCTDYECPNHMKNNNGSCTKCINKNLVRDEIPACFFYKIATRDEIDGDYSVKGFARIVDEKLK